MLLIKMKVYKFLEAKYGLKSLVEKRLKISRFDDLNDPFELIPYNVTHRQHRWALKAMRSQLGQNRGMLCFSATWRDPVLWAHYAEKHQGVCIGFEVPEGNEQFHKVEYVSKRLPFPKSPTLTDTKIILFTKFDSWEYEQEIRVFLALNDPEDGLYFKEFDETLRPVMVIAGSRCKLPKREITQALGGLEKQVEVIKARAGFTNFEIVKDKRGFQ
jgi:hypothetical protein